MSDPREQSIEPCRPINDYTGPFNCRDCERCKLRKEVERLRVIVDKLPQTADGVPATPGMMVYFPQPDRSPLEILVDGVEDWNGRTKTQRIRRYCGIHYGCYELNEVYSTKEAAEAGGEFDES